MKLDKDLGLQEQITQALNSGYVSKMPKNPFKNIRDFRKGFDILDGNKGIIHTQYKDVKVNTWYAWEHFKKNTYDKDRDNIKGGFFETFRDPLFVVEQSRKGQEKPSVYFYRPYYDKKNALQNLFGIGVDSNGKVEFKTYYLDNGNTRLENILNDDGVIIKYKKKLE